MNKLKREEIDWKRCREYLNDEILPRIKVAIDQKEHEKLKEVTRKIEFDSSTCVIRLTLSKRLDDFEEMDLIGGLVGKLADQLNLNANSRYDDVINHEGVRGYSFEPADYSQFKKSSKSL